MTGLDEAFGAALAPLTAELREVRAELRQMRDLLPAPMVSPAEAGRRLGLSEPTVRRRIKDGAISAKRIGRRWLVDLGQFRPVGDEEIARLATEARAGARS